MGVYYMHISLMNAVSLEYIAYFHTPPRPQWPLAPSMSDALALAQTILDAYVHPFCRAAFDTLLTPLVLESWWTHAPARFGVLALDASTGLYYDVHFWDSGAFAPT